MTAESPAALIRRASERLREAAGAATSGPWSIVPGAANVWRFPDEGAPTLVVCGIGNRTDRRVRKEDAAYIALADPVVGAALADWLDAEAAVIESWRDMVRDEDDLDATGVAALTLARSILRETGESDG